MLASQVRRAQLMELACHALLVAALRLVWGWSWPGAIATTLAAGLGVRLSISLTSFTLAAVFRAPREPIGVARTVVMIATEALALMRFNLLDLPWERWRVRPDPRAAPLARPPIVLIHGYFSNRGAFRKLVQRLEAQGTVPIFTPNFTALHAPVETYVDELHAYLETLCAATGQPVVLVAHSMGGLAARAYMVKHGSARIARLVTIASPHHGTRLAALGRGANARQMRVGSAFIAAIAASEAAAPPAVPAISVYTPHDNLVMPQASSVLPWARGLEIPGVGHLEILGHPVVVALVVDEARLAAP